MEINDFLVWLMSSGGAIIAFSWIVEWVPGWQLLQSHLQELYSFLGSAVVALVAWAVLAFVPADILAAAAQPFAMVAGIFLLIYVKDSFHNVTK